MSHVGDGRKAALGGPLSVQADWGGSRPAGGGATEPAGPARPGRWHVPAAMTAACLVACSLGWTAGPLAAAQPPCVSFDVSDLIEARDVTTAEFAAVNPTEKLLELRFQISALVRFGHGDDLFQFLYVIDNPARSLQIVDCFPKTELSTQVTGNIQIEGERSRNHAVDAKLNAGWPTVGDAAVSYQQNGREDAKYRYEVLPPQELVAASGTTQRGAGAYFKLIPSPRSTLDGVKEFGLVVRAPRDWRADYLHVRCVAYGGSRQSNFEHAQPVCGGAGYVVAVHLAGDLEARRSAVEFIERERQLRQTAQQYRGEIAERQYPSLGHKLGAMFSAVDPKIPDRWLDQVVTSPRPESVQGFQHRLPQPVGTAVQEYFASRDQLRQLPPRSKSTSAPQVATNLAPLNNSTQPTATYPTATYPTATYPPATYPTATYPTGGAEPLSDPSPFREVGLESVQPISGR